MAAIWADFPSGQIGLYGSTISNILNGVYAEILDTDAGSSNTTITNDPDPNIGSAGRVLRTLATFNGNQAIRFVLPTTTLTAGFGTRLWMNQLPSTNTSTPYISFRNASNVEMQVLRILSTGAISFAGQTTSGPVVVANSYNHIEVKLFCNATTGTAEVRVNGVPVIAATGLNTGTTPVAQITHGCSSTVLSTAASDSYWKDTIYWDGSGSEVNDFQGWQIVIVGLRTARQLPGLDTQRMQLMVIQRDIILYDAIAPRSAEMNYWNSALGRMRYAVATGAAFKP